MSNTIKEKTVWDYIADLNQRLNRLETGGKPFADYSDTASATIPLSAGESIDTITATLSWVNSNVTTPTKADPMFNIYVDNDNDPDYSYPNGVSLSANQKKLNFEYFRDGAHMLANPGHTRVNIRLQNLDAGPHTYYLYVTWVYLTGGSGSG